MSKTNRDISVKIEYKDSADRMASLQLDTKSQSFDNYLDEINPAWENLRSIITKHPKDTFKFIRSDEGEWLLEINIDLLGLPKETTMSSLYKE